jgi:allophanate hydrolase subunit 2
MAVRSAIARSSKLATPPAGRVQITPSGQPIVMLVNHPTTGGYPVVAVVDPDDIPIAAQARPGSSLRFLRA